VRLVQRYQFRLTRRPDQLLSGKRGIADERLERAFGAGPQIDDVGCQIFRGALFVEVSQNGAHAIERG
jgi:hypothetical protein